MMHLHTNQVHSIKHEENFDNETLLDLTIMGKKRPMLLLWKSKDDVFNVLYMSSRNRNMWKRVKVSNKSYIDCGRYFQYTRILVRGDRHRKLKAKSWKSVLGKLPKEMSDMITLISSQNEIGYKY